jgi:hypothetical protein
MTPTTEALRVVARRMEPLETNFVFLGGAVIELLVDNPTVSELRPTKDVDVVAEVLTTAGFYALESKLRDAGFPTILPRVRRFAAGWSMGIAWTSCRSRPRRSA